MSYIGMSNAVIFNSSSVTSWKNPKLNTLKTDSSGFSFHDRQGHFLFSRAYTATWILFQPLILQKHTT